MNFTLRHDSGESAYLQLYRALRRDITDGVYPFGARLPSKRLLAGQTGLSVVTVQHAYELLCDEGYAESRERSGHFVCYRSGAMMSPAEKPRAERLPSSAVTGPVFPFSVYARTARRVLAEQGERLWVKPPNSGCPALREALADYLARSRGIRVRPAQIIVGAGAEYLYGLIVQLLGRGRVYAIESPSYDKIRRVYAASGVTVDPLRMGPDGIRSDALAATEASVLHVTPYHSFPSGVSVSASKKWEYIRWARRRGAVIVEDDYDSEFSLSAKAEDSLFSLSPEGHVIYLNSFSRTIAPSLRAGYMLLPETLLPAFERELSFYSCAVPVLEQYILTELLNRGDFERHINRVRRRLRRGQTPE